MVVVVGLLVDGTKVVRIYNDKSKPDEVSYLNLRPSTGSIEEYLAPAARYLLSLMKAKKQEGAKEKS